jgi:hypothetical protein
MGENIGLKFAHLVTLKVAHILISFPSVKAMY